MDCDFFMFLVKYVSSIKIFSKLCVSFFSIFLYEASSKLFLEIFVINL
jgi:hypothetical protein